MAKRLSENQKEEIISEFKDGKSINFLSEKFSCTKLTIIRNLKKKLGEKIYHEVLQKSKKSKDYFDQNIIKNNDSSQDKNEDNQLIDEDLYNSKVIEESFLIDQFIEISPLNEEIDELKQKDITSKPLSEINLPETVFLVVKKEIELETKYLRDYPEWHFLPNYDLNRKTIEIYFDLKTAKRNSTKDQKVIKVPNTDVFRIVSPILISRGISRIVTEDNLISL